MADTPYFSFFQSARINAIAQALQPRVNQQSTLRFSNRTPVVPATDNEILARFTGRVQVADIVADDEKAVVYQAGRFNFETTSIPNIKHGVQLTQEQINQLDAIAGQSDLNDSLGIFTNYENRTIADILQGIAQRKELLIIGMMLDGYSYDRLGIKMSGVSWGMPSELKVTPTYAWTDTTNAKPLTDIRTMVQTARTLYGSSFNRLTISTEAFEALCATDQFKNEARLLASIGISSNLANSFIDAATQGSRQELLTRLLDGMILELYDDRYWIQAPNGVYTSTRYWPIEKVLLTSTSDDNNPSVYDFANGRITEFRVSRMVGGGVLGQAPDQAYGPVAYATLAHPQLNPPGIVYWGVQRGFPRKHILQSSAVLTVGSFSDGYSSSDIDVP